MEGIDLLDSREFEERTKEKREYAEHSDKKGREIYLDGMFAPYTCSVVAETISFGKTYGSLVEELRGSGLPLYRAHECAAVCIADGAYEVERMNSSPREILYRNRSRDPSWSFGRSDQAFFENEGLNFCAENRIRGKVACLEMAVNWFLSGNDISMFSETRSPFLEVSGLARGAVEQHVKRTQRIPERFRKNIADILPESLRVSQDTQWRLRFPPPSFVEMYHRLYPDIASLKGEEKLSARIYAESAMGDFYRKNVRLIAFEVWRRERELGIRTRVLRKKSFLERIRFILDSDLLFAFFDQKEKADIERFIIEERDVFLSRVDSFFERNIFLKHLLQATTSRSEKRKISRDILRRSRFPESILPFINLSRS